MWMRSLLIAVLFIAARAHGAEPTQYPNLKACEAHCSGDFECIQEPGKGDTTVYECVPLSLETCEERCKKRKGYVCYTSEEDGSNRCMTREQARLKEEAYACEASCDGSCKRVGKHYKCQSE